MLVIKLNSNNPRLFDGFKFINKKKVLLIARVVKT